MQTNLTFFFFFNSTLLKIESTWPVTQGLGKLTNMHKEQKKLREQKDSSPAPFFSFFQQIVLFIVPLCKVFDCKIFEVQ